MFPRPAWEQERWQQNKVVTEGGYVLFNSLWTSFHTWNPLTLELKDNTDTCGNDEGLLAARDTAGVVDVLKVDLGGARQTLTVYPDNSIYK